MVWYIDAGLYILGLFKVWLHTLFVTPIQTLDMLWILIPVWLAWFFAEFFQEKTGTSMGNAISNSIVILWASIDCARQTVRLMSTGMITNWLDITLRFSLISILLFYGVIIIYFGLKGNQIIKYIGRIREVTYVFAMFVPIFYNTIPFSLEHIFAAIIFFPVFYFTIELIDRLTPNPKAIQEDMEEAKNQESPGMSKKGKEEDLGGLDDLNMKDFKI